MTTKTKQAQPANNSHRGIVHKVEKGEARNGSVYYRFHISKTVDSSATEMTLFDANDPGLVRGDTAVFTFVKKGDYFNITSIAKDTTAPNVADQLPVVRNYTDTDLRIARQSSLERAVEALGSGKRPVDYIKFADELAKWVVSDDC